MGSPSVTEGRTGEGSFLPPPLAPLAPLSLPADYRREGGREREREREMTNTHERQCTQHTYIYIPEWIKCTFLSLTSLLFRFISSTFLSASDRSFSLTPHRGGIFCAHLLWQLVPHAGGGGGISLSTRGQNISCMFVECPNTEELGCSFTQHGNVQYR